MIFSGPVTGLLGRADLCEAGFFSRASKLLVLCSCLFCDDGFFQGLSRLFVRCFVVELQTCVFAALVCCEAGFVSGPVTGLLGRAVAFREALFLVELLGFLFW